MPGTAPSCTLPDLSLGMGATHLQWPWGWEPGINSCSLPFSLMSEVLRHPSAFEKVKRCG